MSKQGQDSQNLPAGKRQRPERKDDDRLDEELKDTFPASDPPSHTPCRPTTDDPES